jgi:hypothetical protein
MMIKRTRNIDTMFLFTVQHLEKLSFSPPLAIPSFKLVDGPCTVLVPALALLLVILGATFIYLFVYGTYIQRLSLITL